MIQIVASAFAALLSLAAVAHAQDQPQSGPVSGGAPPSATAPAKEGTPSAAQEPPSQTAGVRIITRPEESMGASQGSSTAPPVSREAGPPTVSATERYRFERMGDSFVRLDNQNGQIAVCSREAGGWDCRSAVEHVATLESEIAQLRSAISDLKALQKQVDELGRLRADVEKLKQLPQQLTDLGQSSASERKQLRGEIENLQQRRTDVQALNELRTRVDDLEKLQVEIDSLKGMQATVDDLKNQLAALRVPPPAPKAADEKENPPRPPETVPPTHGGNGETQFSPRESINRAAAFISDAWRRLVEMISHLQKEAMRRS